MVHKNTGTTDNFINVFPGSYSCVCFRYGSVPVFQSMWFPGIGITSSQKCRYLPVISTGIKTGMPLCIELHFYWSSMWHHSCTLALWADTFATKLAMSREIWLRSSGTASVLQNEGETNFMILLAPLFSSSDPCWHGRSRQGLERGEISTTPGITTAGGTSLAANSRSMPKDIQISDLSWWHGRVCAGGY